MPWSSGGRRFRLPRPLRYHEVIRFDPSEIDAGILTLKDRISG
jgi:hypothetical protein